MAGPHDPYALSDEDRLPWLEPVDAVDEKPRGLPLILIGWVLTGLALLAIGIGALYWWQNREITPSGSGELIAAPKEPYKVRPTEEGGTRFEGQGDVVYQTSQGAQVQGSLDLSAVPETPVDRAPAPKPAPTPEPKAGKSASAAVSEDGGKLVAKAPPAQLAPEGPAGSTIQLGAFPSEAAAKKKAKAGPAAITAPMCGLGLLDASGKSAAPVCGTKGGMKFTYNNACFAEKDGAKSIKAGACATKGKAAKKAGKKAAKKKG